MDGKTPLARATENSHFAVIKARAPLSGTGEPLGVRMFNTRHDGVQVLVSWMDSDNRRPDATTSLPPDPHFSTRPPRPSTRAKRARPRKRPVTASRRGQSFTADVTRMDAPGA